MSQTQNMTSAATGTTDVVPSVTLPIAPYASKCVIQACEALKKSLLTLKQKKDSDDVTTQELVEDEEAPVPSRVVSTSDNECDDDEAISPKKPLHDQLLEAAKMCEDPLIQDLLNELRELKFETIQIQASLLIFLNQTKEKTVKDSFVVLGHSLSREESAVLFRCLLTALSFCVRAKPNTESSKFRTHKPSKARKEDEHSSPSSSADKQAALKKENEEDVCGIPSKSPSFDTTMDTTSILLGKSTLTEIQDSCVYASKRLYEHAHKETNDQKVSYQDFEKWYKLEGSTVVSWVKLLDIGTWSETQEGLLSSQNSLEQVKMMDVDKKAENTEQKLAPIVPPAASLSSEKKEDEKRLVLPTSIVSSEPKPEAPNFFMVEEHMEPPCPKNPPSRTLVSFDFTGSSSANSGRPSFCIHVTEDNLLTLRTLVQRTNLVSRSPAELYKILVSHSKKLQLGGKFVNVMHKDDFGRCIRDLVPHEAARTFSRDEMENFSIYFTNFFACYENTHEGLGKDVINVTEFAIGFSLLCSGNKSSKLAGGFELMDDSNLGYLNEIQLTDYVRSYLTMLLGISLLSKSPEKHESLSDGRKNDMLEAVVNGARWTLGHFLREHNPNCDGRFNFDSFARWYTEGGYNIAPWLELLDLRKLLSLLPENTPHMVMSPKIMPSGAFRTRTTSPRRRKTPGGFPHQSGSDVLFTFPLAKNRSLVVLREDATYVRSVVEKLGLLSLTPDDIWSDLYDSVKESPPPPSQPWSRSRHRKAGTGKSVDVDQQTFVGCMDHLLQTKARNRRRSSSKSGPIETLENFYHSFDLQQVDRVALNQLMGGLSLLCGGKKSTKLAFSFGLFDGSGNNEGKVSKNPSLNVEDLFVFLRSFLIVMFSCCCQSLDLSADQVGRYIADTAHMVAEDVMRYQWHTRSKDRVDFDDFGEWYNEGGFETAPWLELLDLNKWVLVDHLDAPSHQRQPPPNVNLALKPRQHHGTTAATPSSSHYCPPPPPEDEVDASFFGDDDGNILQMDSMDDMDLMLMQQPSQDKENDALIENKPSMKLPTTPSPKGQGSSLSRALKFHLVSHEDHGGYMVSVSQKRVRHLRHILIESGIYKIDGETASKKILSKAIRSSSKSKGTITYVLEKDDFDSAMRDIVASVKGKGEMSVDTQRALSDILAYIFTAFDRNKTGKVDATDLACGFTVLCHGKKSDKLEYAFEVLDVNRNGKLSRREVSNYLRAFLTVLLCVTTSSQLQSDPAEDTVQYLNGKPCELNVAARAADAGSTWAAGQAFKASAGESLNFDDFADWYTSKGYSSIPWLELLDLRKWVLTE